MMATGLRLSPINTPCKRTSGVYGDGIDNDCDGEIDEDNCDAANHIRRIDDDCARVTPVHGAWSRWLSYTCFCNRELHVFRECTNPVPENGGNPCFGDAINIYYNYCSPKKKCRVDGGFTPWSEFSACSNQCGKGIRTRHRTCTNPKPKNWGSNCTGQYTQYVTCYGRLPCPVDGNWSPWKVSTCSKTCDNGTYFMYRACDSPNPDYGGADCIGVPGITGVCNDMNCNDFLRAGMSNSCPIHIVNFKTGLLDVTILILFVLFTTRMLQFITNQVGISATL